MIVYNFNYSNVTVLRISENRRQICQRHVNKSGQVQIYRGKHVLMNISSFFEAIHMVHVLIRLMHALVGRKMYIRHRERIGNSTVNLKHLFSESNA